MEDVEIDEGDKTIGTYPPLFEGISAMQDDLRARLPLYADDWSRPKSIVKVVNATLFAFLVQLIPALIFADLLDEQTDGNLATAETLMATGIIGVIYALFAGQGLVLLGVTGPAAMLLGRSSGLAETFDAEYFPFFFWVMIWASLLHILTAMSGFVNLVFRITPFTSEIFEFFIAISFMYDAVKSLIEPLDLTKSSINEAVVGAGYVTLLLGITTFFICISLHFAESTWVSFTPGFRGIVTSYNMAIATILVTAISYFPGIENLEIARVDVKVPWNWQPTVDRSWIIHPLEGIGTKGIFGAMFPALLIFLLFFVDHNIGSILTQAPKYKLKKPPSYHWDFFVLGISIAVCGVLGIPPGNGLIPQAPLHTRALSTRTIEKENDLNIEVVIDIEEQRWSALGQAMLMFLALALFVILSWIPRGVLFGVFFYLGYTALLGNGVWARISLVFVERASRPNIAIVEQLNWTKVQLYTFIQVASAVATFCVGQFTPVAYIFPVLIMALVPLRIFLIPRLFTEIELAILDPVSDTEEKVHKERKAIDDMRRSTMISTTRMPGFSSLRVVLDATPGPAAARRSMKRRMSSLVQTNPPM